MSTIGGYDHHDTKNQNRSSNKKKQRRRQSLSTSPAETMTDAEKETDKEREFLEKSEGSLPGNVYFNPFTCEYIVLLPSRHGTNDVPTMSWRQECRVIVSVGRYSKVDDEKMIGGKEEKDGRVKEENDDEMQEMEESRDHVSNSVRGLFSKCATCGTSTSQQYEDQLEKWKTKMGFGDIATVIDEDVLNELKKRKGRWLSHAKSDGGDQHEKINAVGRPFRESWMPTSIDHVDGHLFATSSSSSTTTVTMGMGGGLSSQIFARNNTSIQQRTLLQQYYKVALSERSHDLSSSSSSDTKRRRGQQGGEEQLSYRDLATNNKVCPNDIQSVHGPGRIMARP